MGACISSGGIEITEEDRRRNRDVEKELKEAKAKMAHQVKEIENYRQLVFNNLTHGMKYVLDSMDDMGITLSEDNAPYVQLIEDAVDLRDGQPFPPEYYEPLKKLWEDPSVQKAWERGNEAALPDNLIYFFSDLDRLFDPTFVPNEQDIVQTRARTIGITETVFHLRDHEMLMVDVGGQKSERRKWIHCFQDVTSILFLVSLSGYDQCLIEDKDANQMQDAMTIWDSICHSQWFKQTSIILFLNKNDLFEKKIDHSDIKTFFPDYDGEAGDARAGREYFKKRFARLAQKANQKEREIYIHVTTATDTAMLRVVMAAVEASFCDKTSRAPRCCKAFAAGISSTSLVTQLEATIFIPHYTGVSPRSSVFSHLFPSFPFFLV
ncbi:unnamed protein product [Somion occarium]|uniref:Uncharacterized protein n=1 Tax=Somion occarium TaxID=3059160 RepID=A0ABP1CQK2_9APHY